MIIVDLSSSSNSQQQPPSQRNYPDNDYNIKEKLHRQSGNKSKYIIFNIYYIIKAENNENTKAKTVKVKQHLSITDNHEIFIFIFKSAKKNFKLSPQLKNLQDK